MDITDQSTTKANITEFAKRFLELERQKEILKQDVKALKEEFNTEGVPTAVVVRCVNAIKRKKKKSDAEIFEEEAIEEWLLQDSSIDDSIAALIS